MEDDRVKYRILILGASYGSLLGTKLLMAGHRVTLVCTHATAELINREGTRVRFPIRGFATPIEIHSNTLAGTLSASNPDAVDPREYDLVVFGMQESQYGAQGVRQLMRRIARTRKPCLAIMNMPPLPYLKRIPGLVTEALESCYTDPRVWDGFDPRFTTLASPDPQAFRPPEQPKNVLEVGLATNFKAARFDAAEPTALLRRLEADIEQARFHYRGEAMEVPVQLKVHDATYVPLATWPMLMTGYYRCIRSKGIVPIREAVHGDIDQSREIYEWVMELCTRLGARSADLVPFEKYAEAAQALGKPSAAARALMGGATHIERVDRLIRMIANQLVLRDPLTNMVTLVDERLRKNRMAAEDRGRTLPRIPVTSGQPAAATPERDSSAMNV